MNNAFNLTFFDFCSGIGAGHTALNSCLNFKCVGYSEINNKAEKNYIQLNQINKTIKNWGDITQINAHQLPDFDLMIAGFPCQPFSIVGLRNGIKHDKGGIVFNLINILNVKKPKFLLFENVKGLVNYNNGEMLNIIKTNLIKSDYY